MDLSQLAHRIVERATRDEPETPKNDSRGKGAPAEAETPDTRPDRQRRPRTRGHGQR